MRITSFSLVFLALGVLVGCGGGGGGGVASVVQYGSITGTVYAAAGSSTSNTKSARVLTVGALTTTKAGSPQPIAGATVAVSGYPKLTTTTNAQGVFLIQQVPSGLQTVFISASAYTTLEVPVQVLPGSTPTVVAPPTATKAQYTWTVLVYMDANNDLDPYGIQNCEQMEEGLAANASQVKVLVQFSRPPLPNSYNDSYYDPAGLINADAQVNGLWAGVRRYAVAPATSPAETAMNSTLLQNLGSVDMGNPQTLQQFITWGQTFAPAQHYLVVLWDHGSGWDPSGDAARAICFDDQFGDDIRDTELPTALTASNHLDIVATDACLMAMAEVAYEIRNQASYLVAAEEEVPGAGLPYTNIVSALCAQPTIDPKTFARNMADMAYTSWYSSGYNIATCSAIDLSQMSAVATAQAPFTARLIADSGLDASLLDSSSTTFNCERFGSDLGSAYADLEDYANHFSGTGGYTAAIADAQLQSSAQQLAGAISSAVIENDTGDGHPNAHGMSIYFPNYTDYTISLGGSPSAITNYPLMAMNTITDWNVWLAKQPPQ